MWKALSSPMLAVTQCFTLPQQWKTHVFKMSISISWDVPSVPLLALCLHSGCLLLGEVGVERPPTVALHPTDLENDVLSMEGLSWGLSRLQSLGIHVNHCRKEDQRRSSECGWASDTLAEGAAHHWAPGLWSSVLHGQAQL